MTQRFAKNSWVCTMYGDSNGSSSNALSNADMAFGKVIEVGPKTYTVEWENGTRNRRPHGYYGIDPVKNVELIAELEAARGR